VVEFQSGQELILTKQELAQSYRTMLTRFAPSPNPFSDRELLELLNLSCELPLEELINHRILASVADKVSRPRSLIANFLKSLVNELVAHFLAMGENFKVPLDFEVWHLPTYRRIEEDLEKLGYVPTDLFLPDKLLHSGMGDVKERIELFTTTVRETRLRWDETLLRGYEQLNGQPWNRLLSKVGMADKRMDDLPDFGELTAVADRIYDAVCKQGRDHFLKSFSLGEVAEEDVYPLKDFIMDLDESYQQQRTDDQTIGNFQTLCNRYLVDKEIVYHHQTMTIEIHSKTGRSIELQQLSSGEKQIISIFSKLCFASTKPCVILFDEPELSISIEWQRMLLPDVLKFPSCRLLVAATHSPFIFENDLDIYTVDG
jgi:hypothetical protein